MPDDLPHFVEGAKFLRTEEGIDEWMYPRDPDRYEPTRKFRQRFRELGGCINGQDINDAFEYGELYPAAQGCASFIKDAGGVAFYVIVSANLKPNYEDKRPLSEEQYKKFNADDFDHTAVTVWPYVYDRDRAWNTGRWSGKQLDKIQDIEPDIDWQD